MIILLHIISYVGWFTTLSFKTLFRLLSYCFLLTYTLNIENLTCSMCHFEIHCLYSELFNRSMHFPHFTGVNTPASSPHVVKFCCQWHNWFCHGTVTTHMSLFFGSPILLNILPKNWLSLDCSNIWLLLSFTAFFNAKTDEISFRCYLVFAIDTWCCPCCFLLFKSFGWMQKTIFSLI